MTRRRDSRPPGADGRRLSWRAASRSCSRERAIAPGSTRRCCRRSCPPMPSGRAIDLGAGVGTVAFSLAARAAGLSVIGIERDPGLVACGARGARTAGERRLRRPRPHDRSGRDRAPAGARSAGLPRVRRLGADEPALRHGGPRAAIARRRAAAARMWPTPERLPPGARTAAAPARSRAARSASSTAPSACRKFSTRSPAGSASVRILPVHPAAERACDPHPRRGAARQPRRRWRSCPASSCTRPDGAWTPRAGRDPARQAELASCARDRPGLARFLAPAPFSPT